MLHTVTIDPDTTQLGRTPGLAEDHFVHDGLITKRVPRAVVLGFLRPRPGQLLWDLGTGAGSIAVEWCRSHPGCRATGVEVKPERAANARRNVAQLTQAGQCRVVIGSSLDFCKQSDESPDAVFIGGGLSHDLAQHCLQVLKPGGRFVATAVTLEAEVLLATLHREYGGELVRLGVEISDHIGRLRGWSPLRTIMIWAWENA